VTADVTHTLQQLTVRQGSRQTAPEYLDTEKENTTNGKLHTSIFGGMEGMGFGNFQKTIPVQQKLLQKLFIVSHKETC